MATSAALATSAPFPLPAEQARLLAQVTDALDGTTLWWLSGYVAGLAQSRGGQVHALPAPGAALESASAQRLTIVFGSQTGNARRVAEALAAQAEAAGLVARLLRADAYATRELRDERHLLIVISTQGDGDPPDDARAFVEFIAGKRAPALPQLKFGVLALGDSSYPRFCAIGRQLDARLVELGATRWLDRGEADLDIEAVATPWSTRALELARESLKPQPPLATVTPLRRIPSPGSFTREHPFAAALLANQRITGRGSDRDVRHIELSIEGSGLRYEPGDALGVWPVNPPVLVDAVLATLHLDGEEAVTVAGETLSLREWLGTKRELTRLSRSFVATHAAHARSDALNAVLAPARASDLSTLLTGSQVIDLLQAHPADWSAEELVNALRPLTPRLYSIASSPHLVGDEVHLTVAHVQYAAGDGLRWGTASHFLARSAEGSRLPVFIESNERFRLPQDGARDVVMIGPGTGVAPFRGFVQERAATGASGRNWLLFGNPHARSDFLYQAEWLEALRRGQLHRLDVAFSRDQAHKLYVQQRLREHGAALYAWLESGAHLYVCGATAMAKDVHAALLDIVSVERGTDGDGAAEYINALQAEGRYARDAY
jgi:sulfite reductase (NADPH) flavoprotein alpha-component